MGVRVKEPIASRNIPFRSLRQAITPQRLPQPMREEARPFDPALLTPLLVIVLAAVAEILTPQLQFYRLFGVAPALAAAMFRVPGTLGVGLLATATGFFLSVLDYGLGQPPGNFTLLAVGGTTLAAAYASRVRQHRERTLAEVRSVAETTQRVLLRPVPHHLGQVDIEVLYQAAAAQACIGGDFYEARQTPHGVRLIIGDVRGKGLPAVEAASVMLSSFRVNVRDAPDLPYLAGRMETGMIDYCEDVTSDDALEGFVTVLLVEIPAEEPIARLVNCGHCSPLLLRGGGGARGGTQRAVTAHQHGRPAGRPLPGRHRPLHRRRPLAALYRRRQREPRRHRDLLPAHPTRPPMGLGPAPPTPRLPPP
jgi:hypothetical protein